jgi:uncharacterized phage protein (TIGR01671 family)
MREIKFRAWLKGNEDFDEEDDFKGAMVGYTGEHCDAKRQVGFVMDCDSDMDLDDYIWMQFTGLKDKNGKDIYESDIVFAELVRRDETVKENIVVTYNPNYGFQPFHSCYGCGSGMLYSSYFVECEVVGNIYENPELLEKERDV